MCFTLLSIDFGIEATGKYRGLEFLEPCSKSDPQLETCLTRAANVLTKQFRKGLTQLEYPEVEPIILDEVNIALGGGPNGYKAQFREVTARGVSALIVERVLSNITDEEVQLQLTLNIPKIRAVAKYRSSGTLILVQASGAGDYWGEYDGVKAKVFIRAKPFIERSRKYLKLQQLKMDFSVNRMKMGVQNLQDGNTILEAALNMFINSNSQDLLREMKPDLRRKLVQVMSSFVRNLFDKVPYDAWIED